MSPTTIPGNFVIQSPAANDPLLDLNTQPSLDLQFATSKTLDDRVSGFPLVNHQRDASSGKSAGTYVGSDGLIKTSPVNYSLNSEQVNLWAPNNGSVSSNFAESPIGDQTADKWIPDTTNNFHFPRNNITGLASTGSVTYSIYAKQAGYRYLLVNTPAGSAAGNSGPIVDLQDGVVVDNFGATYSTNITDAGNDWWRIAITFTKSGPALEVDHNPLPTSTIAAYTGDGTSGVLLWGAQLEEGSTATDYIPTTSTISGAPRFDHDPVTGESLGLLIEESRTNLLQYSEQFDQSAWIKSAGASIIPNATSSPDGSQTADKQVGASEANWFICTQFPSVVVSGVYTGSIYAKAGGFRYLRVLDSQGTNKYFDLETGDTSGMEDAGNGWYRCSWTVTATATPYNYRLYVTDNNTGAQPTGDGVKGIYIWGAQLEAGSFPTSYIPTTSSTVTRAADVASIEGTNFSSWYNQSEGTVFVAVDKAYKTNTIAAAFDDGSGANRIEVRSSGSSLSNARYVITDNSTTVYSKESSTAGANRLKLALAYKTGSVNNATNGVIDIVDATASIPNVSRLAFQNEFFLTDQRPGHIARLAYYPYRLADATLQEITS